MGIDLTSRTERAQASIVLRRQIVTPRRSSLATSRVGVAQSFESRGDYQSVLVTASRWFASMVFVQQGALGFADGDGYRAMSHAAFLLYLPPGAFVRMPLANARVRTVGITGSTLPEGWPRAPLAIPCALDEAGTREAISAIVSGADVESFRIDADRGVSARVRLLRQLLLEAAFGPSPASRVARATRTPSSVLSRRFLAEYGISPRESTQRLRVFAAAVALFEGWSISRVALETGWQDVSRFYRQFRRLTGETPGRYRSAAQAVK